MALITLARAQEQIPNFNTADNAILTDMLNACSEVIERYCNRTFAATAYDELYDGQGYPNLFLNNYPIIQVDRVAYNPVNVLQVRNTDQAASRASFRMDADSSTPPRPNNLYLVSVKNGVTTTRTIALSGTVTLNDLATAINGYSADGWAAQALGVYGTWPVADLWPYQGGKECRWFGNAYLNLHSWNLPELTYRAETGELVSAMGFGRGYQNFRVLYTAGYSTIPNPIQQACADLAASVYNQRGQNPALQGENLGSYSYTQQAEKSFRQLDFASRYGLELFKNRRVAKFRLV